MPSDDYARAKGWHIWRGVDMDATPQLEPKEVALCPGHAGNSPRVKPQPIEGEVPLW